MRKLLTLILALLLASGLAQAQTQMVDLRLTLRDGAGGRQVLRFGLAPSATNGIAAGLCESELPPLPPAGIFEARFIGADISVPELGLGSYRDYRAGDKNYRGTQTHELQYQTGAGTIISINWNLPAGVTGLLQDLLGGVVVNQAMTGAGSFVVNNPGIINKLKMTITYTGAVALVAPPPPVLVAPANGATNSSTSPTLAWNDSPSAAAYQLQVSTTSSFAATVVDQSGICDTLFSVSGLRTRTQYYWRVQASNAGVNGGWTTAAPFSFTTPVQQKSDFIPFAYQLSQNFPNPFNPSTAIKFVLPKAGKVTLQIFNETGQLVRALVDGEMNAGRHEISWDGRNQAGAAVASGVYFYQLVVHKPNGALAFTETKRMAFVQ